MTEEQKINELLKPRFKILADWPERDNDRWKVGDIITLDSADGPTYLWKGNGNDGTQFYPDWFEQFPHNFKRLSWWEDRDASEMPEYVKYAEDGTVRKVRRFDLNTTSAWFMYLEGDNAPYCPGGSALENTHWLPATSADYTAYITALAKIDPFND